MRFSYLLSLILLPASALQIPPIIADFYAPLDALLLNETSIPQDQSHDLLKRDGNCPADHNSCSTLAKADAGACCTAGTFCTTDHAKNIACCPSGATCTGTVTLGAAGTASGGGLVFGATTTSNIPAMTTGSTTTTGTASYVQNAYFPFPYIPTTYVNSAACNTAFSACQSNYAACTNDLMGNSFGVTVVAPNGGGVTVAPTMANVGAASATSICSSLSAEACYNIQSGNCAQFGSGTTSGGSFIVADQTGAGARPTMGCMAAAGVMAGLGLAGQIL